jgi:hypothetical protein
MMSRKGDGGGLTRTDETRKWNKGPSEEVRKKTSVSLRYYFMKILILEDWSLRVNFFLIF